MVVEVPADGFFDAFLELEGGFPAEFALELGGVDGVAHVVAGAVGDVGDEVEVLAFGTAEEAVNGVDEDLDEVDVLPFVEAADVVGLGHLALVEDEVDGPGVVLHVEPVAHVLALAIDRQGLAVADVIDEQRDQLLRELIRAVVVAAVGDHGGQSVGVVEGPHEVVAGRLGRAVGAVRLVFEVLREEAVAVSEVVLSGAGLRAEGRLDARGMGQLEGAIDLVGGDVVEPFPLVFLGQGLPIEFRGLQQAERAHDVGLGEGERVLDAAIDMGFRREVDDAIDLLVLHQLVDAVEVADVHPDELVVGFVLDILQIGQVAGVGQLVQVDDSVIGVFVHEEANNMAADEAGAAGDDEGSHRV